MIPNKTKLVIPEAQENENKWTGRVIRPEYRDNYVSMDMGLIHFTGVLFGYMDFKNAQLVIEDEYMANYKSSGEIATECKKKENVST